ncbi:peroxidase family protein [Paracoccus indicus]|uniref:peroxidase family protein n=1 Tax=Paracoccus indicus TaxID=2079229 RepID=UPI000D3CE27B|nr:heme peroxidase family protein [Paracoccus indicus]
MLFSLTHGMHVIQDMPDQDAGQGIRSSRSVGDGKKSLDKAGVIPIDAVVEGGDASRTVSRSRGWGDGSAATNGAFRYMFRDASGIPVDPQTLSALDALADSMATEAPGDSESALPPILTYFGQFIDHDITANTDREIEGLSVISGEFEPVPRDNVEAGISNLRDGSLGLDSLYGDKPGQGPFATKLAGLMRHPTLTNKMRLGTVADSGDGRPPLPADPAADLLRLGFLLDRGEITQAELEALNPALRANFVDDSGPIRTRAILGDGRNDENLLVAQLHVAFLRLHNKLADVTDSFEDARRLTQFHYQWLVLNEYLPAICAGDVADEVLAKGAPLYADFHDAHPSADPAQMPMPLEFSIAAFRFGHSMVRGGYDHNRFFGTAVEGSNQILPFATFRQLFEFTGNGRMPSPLTADPKSSLPGNWVIEWDRMVHAETRNRSSRKIDTHLAEPLNDLLNEPAEPAVMKKLAQRNLRRGYRLNLPSAQSLAEAINRTGLYRPIPILSPEQVREGRDFMQAAGLDTATPLWFYVLREAELTGGHHLGALGSHLVANTLAGLVMRDSTSYWHATIDGNRWSPARFQPSQPIDSLKAMLRFTGLLD